MNKLIYKLLALTLTLVMLFAFACGGGSNPGDGHDNTGGSAEIVTTDTLYG